MYTLSIRKALGDGWGHFTRRGWYLFGITLAMAGISVLVSGEATTTALALIVFAAYLAVLLKHARQEQYVFDDLFTIDRRWIYFGFGVCIKWVLIFIGLLFFIVPGVYLAARWMFSELYIIDQGMRPIESLKASSALTEGYRGKLMAFFVISVGITVVGLLFFFVGVFVSMVWLQLATIMLFWRLQEIQYLKSQA